MSLNSRLVTLLGGKGGKVILLDNGKFGTHIESRIKVLMYLGIITIRFDVAASINI
jgi:hypothetical protein